MVRQAQRNYIGSYVSGDLGGVKVGNTSLQKYMFCVHNSMDHISGLRVWICSVTLAISYKIYERGGNHKREYVEIVLIVFTH